MILFHLLYSLVGVLLALMALHLLYQVNTVIRRGRHEVSVSSPASSDPGLQIDVPSEHGRQATSYCVLIPAHNEAGLIGRVVSAVNSELTDEGRVVVIADNCTDDTAAIARAHGAAVIERQDSDKRGKHHALRYAIDMLAADPPAVVVILDADCTISAGFFSQLLQTTVTANLPAQARYSLEQPDDHHSLEAISVFAWEVKNHIRTYAMTLCGAPCILTGSGMVLPWRQLVQALPQHQSLAEDINLSLSLVRCGFPPVYCPGAVVMSTLPGGGGAQRQQRTRWEHGHLSLMLREIPSLLVASCYRRQWKSVLFAFDLLVPPLALLVIILSLYMAGATVLSLAGTWLPMVLATLSLVALATAILHARRLVGFPRLDRTLLLTILRYIRFKVSIYLAFLRGPEKRWIKTER